MIGIVFLALIIARVQAQDITGAANCTVKPDCTGAGGVSCLYCPLECGTCPSQHVYDHCVEPGTAHISIDDGPASTIELILDILRDESIRLGYPVRASFWMIGNLVANRADSVRR